MGCFGLGLNDRPLGELVTEAQEELGDDSPAMGEIVRRFDDLAIKEARRLTADPYLRGDLANSARVALTTAVRRHDSSRGAFPAYGRAFMRGAVLRAWKQLRGWGRGIADTAVSLTDFTDPASEPLVPSVALDAEGPWGNGATASAVASLADAQQELLQHRYAEDQSLAEIGRRTRTTVSAVRQRLDTAHRAVARQLAA